MTQPADLMASIIANPADDVLRLAYSDLLEEQGQSEGAEFIRVQCDLAKMACVPMLHSPLCGPTINGSRCEGLRRRERELLDAGYKAGWNDFPANMEEWWFRRGFLAHIRLSAEYFLCIADSMLVATPIEEVTLTTWPEWVWLDESGRKSRSPQDRMYLLGRGVHWIQSAGYPTERGRALALLAAEFSRTPPIKFNLPPERITPNWSNVRARTFLPLFGLGPSVPPD